MPGSKLTRPTKRHSDYKLPEMFRRRFCWQNAPDKTWIAYQSTGDAAALAELVEHYAPLVTLAVMQAKRRNPDFYCEPVLDLLNDGALGLIRGITNYPAHMTGRQFYNRRAYREIHRQLHREVMLRRFGVTHRQSAKRNVIADFRALFVQDHGRLPNDAEVSEHLRGLLVNPNLSVGGVPTIVALGSADDPKDASRQIERLLSREDAPDARAINAETRRLMLKEVRGDDRKMLRMILRGDSIAAIARAFSKSYAGTYMRISGLLWSARARADLARHADAEPMPVPAKDSRRHLPRFALHGFWEQGTRHRKAV